MRSKASWLRPLIRKVASNWSVVAIFSTVTCLLRKKHLDQEVLGPIGNALLGSKLLSSMVVFGDEATDGGLEVKWQVNYLQVSPRRSQSVNSVLMLALRSEYLASNVDRDISIWK